MSDLTISVEHQQDQIIASGPGISGQTDPGPWMATRFDSGRILLVSKSSGSTPHTADGFAKCTIDVVYDILIGLNRRHWSGVIAIDTGFGQKKLYFNQGNLTFASSTLIDDRLGEVIYREEMISLDQMTNSSVQVDRSTKFGQVLLKDKIFTNTDLWTALKNQVFEIFRSVFIMPEVYLEITKGEPPTEVTFEQGTDALINSAYSAGKQFRAFFTRLRSETTVTVIEGDRVKNLQSGTFLADMVQLVRKCSFVSDLLDVSKLTDMNTLWVLHRMSCLGYISFDALESISLGQTDANFGRLRSKIDSFLLLQTISLKAFVTAGVTLPIGELQKFAWSLNEGQLAAIYIEDNGLLGSECVGNIMSQCIGNSPRLHFFELRFDSLTRYVLQLCGDLLAVDLAKSVKKQYAEISGS